MLRVEMEGGAADVVASWESEEAHAAGEDPVEVRLILFDLDSGIQLVVPFAGQKWQAFKKYIASDGKETPVKIEIPKVSGI